MILKVQGAKDKAGEEWLFIDKLDVLHEKKKAQLTQEEFDKAFAEADHTVITKTPAEVGPGKIKVAIVTAVRAGGTKVTVLFDTVAYICNDKGDTLEKVWSY